MSYILCHVHIPGEEEPEEVLVAAVPRIGEKLCLGSDKVNTLYEVIAVEYQGFASTPKGKNFAVRLTVKQARQPTVGGKRQR